jgi:hypothetical protein
MPNAHLIAARYNAASGFRGVIDPEANERDLKAVA